MPPSGQYAASVITWLTVLTSGNSLREKASAIKRHTITHLDEYLDQFATNAEKNGVEVHWAKDAKEFNEIVYGILKNHDVKKMVKSKSMLTEECEMNPYLEERGIEVVETDLGRAYHPVKRSEAVPYRDARHPSEP